MIAMSLIADCIRESRNTLDLDQATLALAVGVSQQTVSRWESGDGIPPARRIPALARALQVDAEHLSRLAGYLPDSHRSGAWEAFHAAFARIAELSHAELVRLIEQAWEELRRRQRPDTR